MSKEEKFTKRPWRLNKVHVKNALQEGEHEEYCIETFDFKEIATVFPLAGNKDEALANAELLTVAPDLYEFAHFFETFAGQAYLKILPDEAGQKIYNEAVKLCKMARGEKDEMTQEQIRVCREYLDIINMIKEYKDGDISVPTPYAFDYKRREVHNELLEVYGFKYESDTWDVTNDIPDGMTPRELHDKLMDLKRMMEAK